MSRWVAVLFAAALVSSCGPARGRRVEEALYLVVGGIEQWVTIRADDDRKPVLLVLHGGPGDVQSPYRAAYAPYERDFVLVQWDERGAGRTFARSGAVDVTLERLAADGLDLASQLRARFPGQPLVVMGHSWGSIVATSMVRKRPDLFAAYVGSGQVSSWAGAVQFQFDFLKAAARRKGDATMLASLEAIGRPDPTDVRQYFAFSRPIRQNLNPSDAAWFAGMLDAIKADGATEADLKAIGDGMAASGRALIDDSVRTNLPETARSFALPYFVIQGRHDLFTPTPLAEHYFAQVEAPRKEIVILKDAGHFAIATHARECAAELRRLLR